MCPSNQEQQNAQLQEARRIGRRALTLSRSMMRCDALVEAGGRELQLLDESGADDAKNREGAAFALKRMQNTTFTRADAYFTFALATLYAVVEKWIAWDFADPAVDALLADKAKLRRLKNYRNTVFHADYYDHADFAAMATDLDLVSWSAQLASPIRAYLTRWHADPVRHVHEQMQRARSGGAS
ncbi:MAG: hypothetical protein E6H61_05335 [Betaproteobacteria bacterium]|nr:MAG: hypothetical protein E6H61_05335 [Betaproteobacteria bacterium]